MRLSDNGREGEVTDGLHIAREEARGSRSWNPAVLPFLLVVSVSRSLRVAC